MVAMTSPSTSEAVEVIAEELRSLRAIKGHFEGGVWDDRVDQWGGRKQELMTQLGSRFGLGTNTNAQVVDLLGPPDQIVREGDRLFEMVARQSIPERSAHDSLELLIYYWRGAHDFLYFRSNGRNILGSGWWYAYE
jgi:hypothetical protein